VVKETENTVKKSRTTKKAESISAPAVSRQTAPEETNDKVGQMLHNERLKKGLELRDISQILCIRCFYLQAIEDGNYAELPSLPYSAGFVNSYAKYLGMNNTRITQLFREELNVKPEHKGIFMIDEPTSEARLPGLKYIIGSVFGLVLLALLWSFIFGGSAEKTLEDTKNATIENEEISAPIAEIEYFTPNTEDGEESAISVKNEQPATSTTAEKQIEETLPQTASSEQIIIKEENFPEEKLDKANAARTIEVKITKEDTWIEVRDSKKIYINKVLHPGESYLLPEGDGMILSVGKYAGVEVRVNGVLTPVIKPNHKMNIQLDDVLNAH